MLRCKNSKEKQGNDFIKVRSMTTFVKSSSDWQRQEGIFSGAGSNLFLDIGDNSVMLFCDKS